MVDFQSRDSRPTYGGDEDEGDEGDEEDAEAESADELSAEPDADAAETAAGETDAAETDAADAEVADAEVADADAVDATVENTETEQVETTEQVAAESDTGDTTAANGTAPGTAPGTATGTATGSATGTATGSATGTGGGAASADDGETERPGDTDPATGEVTASADLGIAVVTVDGDLTVEEDRAGGTAIEVLEDAGMTVPTREVIAAEYDNVQQNLGGLLVRDDVDAIVTLGGDGLGEGEVTVDAARALFDRELPGFGELFRARARESIGTGVLRTRATAGIVDGVPVFCLPGTAGSARLGLSEIILPEMPAIVDELQS